MNILQLAPQVPFPLSDGGKVGIFNITKHLARRGHRITMLALQRTDPIDYGPLEEYCDLVTVPHSNENSVSAAVANLLSDLPYNISKYRSRTYEEALRNMLCSKSFDVVHCDHLHMAYYGVLCKTLTEVPIVLREHNIESLIVSRYAERVRIPGFRWWLNVQKHRIRAYEAHMTAEFDANCVITEADRRKLLDIQPSAHTVVIPAGVDESLLRAPAPTEKIPFSVAMVGSFDWPPNQDALWWFVHDILPRVVAKVPEVTLHVIGKEVPARVKAMEGNNLVVRGFVPDLGRELSRYHLMVVPLRVGGGMRLKIIESFALRVPVVSTSIGCEGIECEDDVHILHADTEEAFVRQIERVFRDATLGGRLATDAYALVNEHYRWDRIAEQFEQTYLTAGESRIRRPRVTTSFPEDA